MRPARGRRLTAQQEPAGARLLLDGAAAALLDVEEERLALAHVVVGEGQVVLEHPVPRRRQLLLVGRQPPDVLLPPPRRPSGRGGGSCVKLNTAAFSLGPSV